jgi:ParB family chromosome partitioning protein
LSLQALNLLVQIRFPALSLQASHMAVHMHSLQSLEQSLQLLLGCSALRPSTKERNDTMKKLTQAEYLPIDKLKPFEGHPFYVKDDNDMEQLTESIRQHGVLNPIMVCPLGTDEYEVISGHRRLHACKKAGIEMIPAFIYSMDRSEAIVAMVDSNLHREKLLPSEKAFAYKMKLEALNHQGTPGQPGPKWTRDSLAEGVNDSSRQIHRYIRLTNLIPGILQKVDSGEIALTPAVELSYLDEDTQKIVLDAMEQEDCTPSYSQTVRMKKLYNSYLLDEDTIYSIMAEEKANQREKISFHVNDLRGFFPRGYTASQMSREILQALEERRSRIIRERNRDDR